MFFSVLYLSKLLGSQLSRSVLACGIEWFSKVHVLQNVTSNGRFCERWSSADDMDAENNPSELPARCMVLHSRAKRDCTSMGCALFKLSKFQIGLLFLSRLVPGTSSAPLGEFMFTW